MPPKRGKNASKKRKREESESESTVDTESSSPSSEVLCYEVSDGEDSIVEELFPKTKPRQKKSSSRTVQTTLQGERLTKNSSKARGAAAAAAASGTGGCLPPSLSSKAVAREKGGQRIRSIPLRELEREVEEPPPSSPPSNELSQDQFETFLFQIIQDSLIVRALNGDRNMQLRYDDEGGEGETQDVDPPLTDALSEEGKDEEAVPNLPACPIVRDWWQHYQDIKLDNKADPSSKNKGRRRKPRATEKKEVETVKDFVFSTGDAKGDNTVKGIKQTFMFPCVVEFLLRLCRRIESSTTTNTEGTTALVVFQRILEEAQRSVGFFAELLFVSCPSCYPLGCYQTDSLLQALLVQLGHAAVLHHDPEVGSSPLRQFGEEEKYFSPEGGIYNQYCQQHTSRESVREFWRNETCPFATTHQAVYRLFLAYRNGQRTRFLLALSPPRFRPWPFLQTTTPPEAPPARGRKGKAKVPPKQKVVSAAERQWASLLLSRIQETYQHNHPQNGDKGRNERYQGIEAVYERILEDVKYYTLRQQHDEMGIGAGGFDFFFFLKPHMDTRESSFTTTTSRYLMESLFSILDVTNHIGLLLQDTTDGTPSSLCTCSSQSTAASTSTISGYIEHHDRHLCKWTHSLESDELVPHSSVSLAQQRNPPSSPEEVDMGIFESEELNKGELYYSRGSHLSFVVREELLHSLSVDDLLFQAAEANNSQCEVDKALTDEVISSTLTQLHHSYLTGGRLMRHQIQNLLLLSRKESVQFKEYFEFPLVQYYPSPDGKKGTVKSMGSLFYCALTGRRYYVHDTTTLPTRHPLCRPLYGGFFCDTVGLGKTLSIAAVCALDNFFQKEKKLVVTPHHDRVEMQAEEQQGRVPQKRVWCSTSGAPLRPLPGVQTTSTTHLYHLPHTTLVVVPMAIVAQWEQELIRFYPSATYILYYSTKRFQYTPEDFKKADFVITTYETLSTHLREETDFYKVALEEKDDAIRQEIATHFAPLQRAFMKRRSSFSLPFNLGYRPATSPPEPSPVPIFRVGKFEVLWDTTHPMTNERVFSDAFLDRLFDFLKQHSDLEIILGLICPNDLMSELCQESLSVRRLFTEKVLLRRCLSPSPLDPRPGKDGFFFPVVLKYIKDIYQRRLSSPPSANAPNITNFLFRRVILDECQKCGSSSLLHYINAEKRWAVSGTPVNNENLRSLSMPFHFLGAAEPKSIFNNSPVLNRYHQRSCCTQLRYGWGGVQEGVEYHCNCGVCMQLLLVSCQPDGNSPATREAYQVRNHTDDHGMNFHHGMNFFHGRSESIGPSGLVPPLLEVYYGMNTNYLGPDVARPVTFFEIMRCFMIRHERNSLVQVEMQLQDPIHQAHPIPLLLDEQFYYGLVAKVISDTARRLDRQGLLTSRVSAVLQWIQDLMCLCIHPSLRQRLFLSEEAGEEIPTANLAERLISHYGNRTNEIAEEYDERFQNALDSFVTITSDELLSWLEEKRKKEEVVVSADTQESAENLHRRPPVFPTCTICLETMADPTYLTCLHYFCKECCMELINSSVSYAGNITAKCPMCRDKKALLEEKRVVRVEENVEEATDIPQQLSSLLQRSQSQTEDTPLVEESYEERLERIGDGSRVGKIMQILESTWTEAPGDKFLIFSKYPQALRLVLSSLNRSASPLSFDVFIIDGSVPLTKRRSILTQLNNPHRSGVLLLTSRASCAGLNLTFANHVLFLEPNLNPAMEAQAIGRVHRFGQRKQVYVHHVYSPLTIEELLYQRSVRLLDRLRQAEQERLGLQPPPDTTVGFDGGEERNRIPIDMGRLNPEEMLRLLTYPIEVLPPE